MARGAKTGFTILSLLKGKLTLDISWSSRETNFKFVDIIFGFLGGEFFKFFKSPESCSQICLWCHPGVSLQWTRCLKLCRYVHSDMNANKKCEYEEEKVWWIFDHILFDFMISEKSRLVCSKTRRGADKRFEGVVSEVYRWSQDREMGPNGNGHPLAYVQSPC